MAKSPETVGPQGEWEITHVADNPRKWDAKKGGPMLSYRINLKCGDKSFERVELTQKESTDAPTVGQKMDGEVQRRFYGANDENTDLQFRKAARGGGYGGGGGGRSWKPRPDDAPPVWAGKQAQIVAQHSQNMALRVLELAHASDRPAAEIMGDLGVKTTVQKARCVGCGQMVEPNAESAEGDTVELGIVDAFALYANEAFERAWQREDRGGAVRDALAAL